jgi:hypothetical protein
VLIDLGLSVKLRRDVYALHNLVLALKQQGRDQEAYATYTQLITSYASRYISVVTCFVE